jgi:hypothetical protein
LYAVHAIGFNNRAAVRWYRLNAANFEVIESGTIADPQLNYFYPSIAANPAGVVVIGFSGCSSTTFASSFAVVGQTVGGVTTFGAPLLLKSGVASYISSPERWGDYSTTCVDPADPNRFWTIQEFASGPSTWSTQITEILTALPQLDFAKSGTNLLLSWAGTAIAFDLESTDSLSAPTWASVGQSQTAANGLVSVSLPVATGPKFFRLRKL